jgi:hypothetical protein
MVVPMPHQYGMHAAAVFQSPRASQERQSTTTSVIVVHNLVIVAVVADHLQPFIDLHDHTAALNPATALNKITATLA